MEEGRDPGDVKFFLGIMPIIGRTLEEAEAKLAKAKQNLSVNGGLARFCGFTNVDLSGYAIDEEFDFEGAHHDNSIIGVIDNIKLLHTEGTKFTPRVVAESKPICSLSKNIPGQAILTSGRTVFALGSSGPRPVGTPEMVADFFEKWWREGDLDGFNVNCSLHFPSSSLPSHLLTTSRCLQSWLLRRCSQLPHPRAPKTRHLLGRLYSSPRYRA